MVDTKPLDARHTIGAESFTKSGAGEWLSPEVTAPFAFDELIYSWNLRLPKGQGFRLHLQAGFGGADKSPWLYAGYWGEVKDPVTSRTKPRFDRGEVDMDWLKLKERAVSYQFKVVDASSATLTVLPSLTVVTTDNHPTPEVIARHGANATTAPARLLDLPFRRQMDSAGNITPNRCQSAALATALEYYGKAIPLEQLVAHTWTPNTTTPACGRGWSPRRTSSGSTAISSASATGAPCAPRSPATRSFSAPSA